MSRPDILRMDPFRGDEDEVLWFFGVNQPMPDHGLLPHMSSAPAPACPPAPMHWTRPHVTLPYVPSAEQPPNERSLHWLKQHHTKGMDVMGLFLVRSGCGAPSQGRGSGQCPSGDKDLGQGYHTLSCLIALVYHVGWKSIHGPLLVRRQKVQASDTFWLGGSRHGSERWTRCVRNQSLY